jgi:adenylosuccinate synthase
MPCTIVVGAQWGDEGKGKIVDLLSERTRHIVRAQGGNNAGHTVVVGNEEYKLHLIPSGILHPHTTCWIAGGTVIDPQVLVSEIKELIKKNLNVEGRLFVSKEAHVILPYHRLFDQLIEQKKGAQAIGTTGRGIGPCYADKTSRIGIRIAELMDERAFAAVLKSVLEIKNGELKALFNHAPLSFDEIFSEYQSFAKFLKPYVAPVEEKVFEAAKRGETVLLEGAQGTFLDITFGTYPYVTSSSTLAAGICLGAGLGPSAITHTLGVVKAYTTRVGQGPFPTEVSEDQIFLNHKTAREYGTTTQRKRRIGWFDAVLVKNAARLNGLNSIAVTKLDVLDHLEEIKICIGYKLDGKVQESIPLLPQELARLIPIYETHKGWNRSTKAIEHFQDLPSEAKSYLERIQELVGVPISLLSLGPAREQTLFIDHFFANHEAT